MHSIRKYSIYYVLPTYDDLFDQKSIFYLASSSFSPPCFYLKDLPFISMSDLRLIFQINQPETTFPLLITYISSIFLCVCMSGGRDKDIKFSFSFQNIFFRLYVCDIRIRTDISHIEESYVSAIKSPRDMLHTILKLLISAFRWFIAVNQETCAF